MTETDETLRVLTFNIVHGGLGINDKHRLDFSSNLNPLGPPPPLYELALEAIQREIYMYFPDERKLASIMADFEEVNEDDILVLPGASFAIHMIFEELERDTNIVIMQNLTYTDYYRYSEHRDRILVNSIVKNGKIILNLDELQHTIESIGKEKKILVVIVTPNNPTGTYIKVSDIEKIVEQNRNNNVRFVIDLSFIDFVSDSRGIWRRLLEYNNVYVVKSYTKILATPGLRIGILAHRNIRRFVHVPSWPICTVSEYVICRLFREYRDYIVRYIDRTREYIAVETNRVIRNLRKLGLKVYSSDVHFFLLRYSDNLDLDLLKYNIVIKKVCKLNDNSCLYRISIRTRQDNNLLIHAMSEIVKM